MTSLTSLEARRVAGGSTVDVIYVPFVPVDPYPLPYPYPDPTPVYWGGENPMTLSAAY